MASPDGSITYTLKHPITVAGETLTVLVFRKPHGKEMRSLPAGAADHWTFGTFLDFGAAIADVPPSTMDLLDADDVLGVVEIAGGFIAAGRATTGSA